MPRQLEQTNLKRPHRDLGKGKISDWMEGKNGIRLSACSPVLRSVLVHIFGFLIIPEAEINRVPQSTVLGQFRVGNLSYKFGRREGSVRKIFSSWCFPL